MILTNCAACAAPLAHDAPRCVRCETRYCSVTCLRLHESLRRAHSRICEDIQRGGGAEQYHADKKYKEAVAVAVEACADDTEGQTCYICYGEGDEEEGLVRMCACRGGNGFAHVSCLAEQAKILVARAEENNLDDEVLIERFARWYTCGLCKQDYYGVVRCALGWACWKTYVKRPETDWARRDAMNELGLGLHNAKHDKEALAVFEANLSLRRRLGASEARILTTQSNLALCIEKLGQPESALRLKRDVYSGRLELFGEEHVSTLIAANNYASSLKLLRRFEEAKALLRRTMPVARRVLGDSNILTHRMRKIYSGALYRDPAATLDDVLEAVTMLKETKRTAKRVLGNARPLTKAIVGQHRRARATLRARLREYRQTADLAILSARALKALVRERNLNIRYPIERSELIAALAAPKEAGRWVFWEGVTKVR